MTDLNDKINIEKTRHGDVKNSIKMGKNRGWFMCPPIYYNVGVKATLNTCTIKCLYDVNH